MPWYWQNREEPRWEALAFPPISNRRALPVRESQTKRYDKKSSDYAVETVSTDSTVEICRSVPFHWFFGRSKTFQSGVLSHIFCPKYFWASQFEGFIFGHFRRLKFWASKPVNERGDSIYLQSIGSLVDDENVEDDIILVNMNIGLSVHGVGESGELFDFVEFWGEWVLFSEVTLGWDFSGIPNPK